MDKIKNYLLDNGYNITLEEHKSYGSYYIGKKKYNKYKQELELIISDIKSTNNIYISIKENHFRGNCNGYVDKIEDITPIVEFITRDRQCT